MWLPHFINLISIKNSQLHGTLFSSHSPWNLGMPVLSHFDWLHLKELLVSSEYFTPREVGELFILIKLPTGKGALSLPHAHLFNANLTFSESKGKTFINLFCS